MDRLEIDEELPNYDEVTRGRVINRSEEKMKSDLEELDKRQRLLAEEEKSSKENIEQEKKKERESIEKERQTAMLHHRKEAEVVQEKRKKWEMKKKQDTQTLEKIVTLNVGGTKYTTSLSTLTKYPDSMLGAMFNGRYALPQQEDGSFFIDRDGDTFSNILSYLRDRNILLSIIPVLSTEVRLRLQYKAKFYQLQELEAILSVVAAPKVYSIISYNKSRQQSTKGTATAPIDLDYGCGRIAHPNVYVRKLSVERAKVTKNAESHHPLCFEEAVNFLNCNLSEFSFDRCCFEGPVSFEGCLMQGTIFQNVCGLVTQKVHFAPWQVSQATFDDGLLEALEANGCIY